ncbi:MAG: hypothetical protein HN623_04020, partial [Bdellovibrionales bacterium]|nr:hypothetical protein [Bdellovibrionales bacterium]
MSPSNYLGHLLIWIVVVTLSHSLNATEAVVTVLRAPLFKQRSFKSAIVQYLSRGEKLFIHARDIGGHSYQEHYDSLHFDRSTLQGTVLSQIPDDGETLIVDLDRMEDVEGYLDSMIDADQKDGQLYFVQTIDRRGAVAYVAREHIKIIYRDDRENDKPVSSLPRDYTDYRLTEPLPDGYPLHRLEQYRLQILPGGGG